MVDIHSARQDAKYIRNAGYGTAATIIEELCDEIKQLLEANEWLKAQRILDNEEATRLYDFARDKGAALERAAVVAWLREAGHSGALDVEVTGVPVSERERAILRRVVTMALCEAAHLVDSGEHRREEEK